MIVGTGLTLGVVGEHRSVEPKSHNRESASYRAGELIPEHFRPQSSCLCNGNDSDHISGL